MLPRHTSGSADLQCAGMQKRMSQTLLKAKVPRFTHTTDTAQGSVCSHAVPHHDGFGLYCALGSDTHPAHVHRSPRQVQQSAKHSEALRTLQGTQCLSARRPASAAALVAGALGPLEGRE